MTQIATMYTWMYIVIAMILIINTIGNRVEAKKMTIRDILKQKNHETVSFEIQTVMRMDETKKGQGIVMVSGEGDIQIEFEDLQEKQKHFLDSKSNVHAIQFQNKEMVNIIQTMQKVEPFKGEEENNILCQPMTIENKNGWLDTIVDDIDKNHFDQEVNQCKRAYGTELFGRYMVVCVNENEQVDKMITSNMIVYVKKSAIQKIDMDNAIRTCQQGALQRAIFDYLEQAVPQKEKKPEGPWFKKETFCQTALGDDKACALKKRSMVEGTNKNRTCIFLHGVGEWQTGPTTNTFPEYWGHLEKYTPHCAEHKFIHQETKFRGWNDESLQRAFCDLMIEGNEPGDRVVRNKILYVHSMGNLVLPAAIRSGMCTIDSTTTSYYDVQGPYLGSVAAIFIQKVCANNDTNPVYHTIAKLGGYCIKEEERAYPAYLTLSPDFPDLVGLKEIALRYQNGALCGTSPLGLYTPYSVLYLLSKIVHYPSGNDGMVPIESCTSEGQTYEQDYTAKYYDAACNHADGTCRSGDGWWNRDRAPCSWYSQRQ